MSQTWTTPQPIPTATPVFEMVKSIVLDFVLPIIVLVIALSVTVYLVQKFSKYKFKSKNNDLLFKDFNIGQYKIVMMRKIAGKYVEIERIKMKINEQKFRYNNKDFSQFDKDKIAWSDKNSNYYAFDYDSGEQLNLNTKGLPEKISIDVLDIYVNRKLIEQLVQGLETPKGKGQWLMLIIGVILGCVIGFLIGQQVTTYQINQETETAKIVLSLLR